MDTGQGEPSEFLPELEVQKAGPLLPPEVQDISELMGNIEIEPDVGEPTQASGVHLTWEVPELPTTGTVAEATTCKHCDMTLEEHDECSHCSQCTSICSCVRCEGCDSYSCCCNTCGECGENEDDCECSHGPDEYEIAVTNWLLPGHYNLDKSAANFYLLYDLWLDGKDEGEFQKFADELLTIFKNYTDMVVGGELRHASRSAELTALESRKEMAPLLACLHNEMDGHNFNRGSAWETWQTFREEHGTDALDWGCEVFRTFRGSGYGGPLWANIAESLMYLERGEITPVMFLDMCWGLEHNGGAYFNKMPWNMQYLKRILDANLIGDMDTLLKHASETTRELYKNTQTGG